MWGNWMLDSAVGIRLACSLRILDSRIAIKLLDFYECYISFYDH